MGILYLYARRTGQIPTVAMIQASCAAAALCCQYAISPSVTVRKASISIEEEALGLSSGSVGPFPPVAHLLAGIYCRSLSRAFLCLHIRPYVPALQEQPLGVVM